MTSLNMVMRNANATIVHGNTLSMECFGGYQTASTALRGAIRPLTAEQAKAIVTATARQTQPAATGPTADAPAPQPSPPASATPAVPFTVNKKGQMGFDF